MNTSIILFIYLWLNNMAIFLSYKGLIHADNIIYTM